MTILGGTSKHDWSVQEIDKAKDQTHQHYTSDGDVAGQLLKEETYKGYCELNSNYYKTKLGSEDRGVTSFIKKFFDIFKDNQ